MTPPPDSSEPGNIRIRDIPGRIDVVLKPLPDGRVVEDGGPDDPDPCTWEQAAEMHRRLGIPCDFLPLPRREP